MARWRWCNFPGRGCGPGAGFCAGWRLTPYPAYGSCGLPLIYTAGAGGLKIAETFPEGRGSPHGCGLRAVICTDAASARPEAAGISRRYHEVAILAARAREYRGRRRLAALCALPAP